MIRDDSQRKLFWAPVISLALVLLLVGLAQALKLATYDAITLNGSSTNQTQEVDEHYTNTRCVFSYNASANMTATPMTVYYQLFNSGSWISAGSPTLNGTSESNLVVDIDSVGVTDLKFSGNATGTVVPAQYEEERNTHFE